MTTMDADFFERQVDYLVAAGQSPSEALGRVRALVPEPATDPGHRSTADALDAHLATLRAALGPALPEVASALRAFGAEVSLALVPTWHAWRGLVVHMAMLAFVAFLVAWLMGTFVLPQMEATYRSFGADLPPVTRTVLRWSDSLALPLLFAAPALLSWWLLRRAQAASSLRLAPCKARFALRLLGSGGRRLWAAYEITVARAALAAGFEPDAAIDLGLRYGREWHGEESLWTADGIARARLAGRLGTLAWELDYQKDASWRGVPLGVIERREWVALAASLLLGAAVGLYVIALYLPIFKISSVI